MSVNVTPGVTMIVNDLPKIIDAYCKRDDLSPAEKVIVDEYTATRQQYEQALNFLNELARQVDDVEKQANKLSAVGKNLENMIIKLASAGSEGDGDGTSSEPDSEVGPQRDLVVHEGDGVPVGPGGQHEPADEGEGGHLHLEHAG